MKSRYILLFIIFYCHYSLASDYWITSNNPRVFYSNEWKQLPIISPKINVFKFYYQVIQRMPTSELRSTLRYLKKNNIKLAIEVPGLVWVDHGDGYAVEGYGPSFFHKDIAHRIKVAGGTIDYIAIDEVIFMVIFRMEQIMLKWMLNQLLLRRLKTRIFTINISRV